MTTEKEIHELVIEMPANTITAHLEKSKAMHVVQALQKAISKGRVELINIDHDDGTGGFTGFRSDLVQSFSWRTL